MRLCFVIAMMVLTGCYKTSEDYNYECTVDRVKGTFVTSYMSTKSKSRMITMYRTDDDQKRTFLFPSERVQCVEKL